MNAKQLFTAAALVLTGVSAFAVEGEQFVPPTGTLTRAEVKAELARAQVAGEVVAVNEAYGGFAVAKTTTLARDVVRGEARAVAQSKSFSSLYVGG
jgi:hypothetical protein